jgi:hypothetical protein
MCFLSKTSRPASYLMGAGGKTTGAGLCVRGVTPWLSHKTSYRGAYLTTGTTYFSYHREKKIVKNSLRSYIVSDKCLVKHPVFTGCLFKAVSAWHSVLQCPVFSQGVFLVLLMHAIAFLSYPDTLTLTLCDPYDYTRCNMSFGAASSFPDPLSFVSSLY